MDMMDIPICPNCKRPTKRKQGITSCTDMYFPPIYDENGVNINPDRNWYTTEWKCMECGKRFIHSTNGSVSEVKIVED